MLTGTMGSGVVPDHSPDSAGLPGFALVKVTATAAELPALFSESTARAVSAWAPLVNLLVSRENE